MITRQASQALRISHVGLRGVVGTGMTAAHVIDFATAFGTFLETPGPVNAISVDPTLPFPRIAEPRPDTLQNLSEPARRGGIIFPAVHLCRDG